MLNFKPFGAHAALIEWESIIEERQLYQILNYTHQLKEKFSDRNFEYIPSYASLVVIDLDGQLSADRLIQSIKEVKINSGQTPVLPTSEWLLPVCYDDEFAPDMMRICEEKGLNKESLIKKHTNKSYTVYCIGFLPGFMYLGGLDKQLVTPRLKTPRLKVPAGAVGIAGSQAGIYPQESPGGWNIIGNCPVQLFNVTNSPPCFVSVGDRIRFESITKPTYEIIKIKVETGIYIPIKKKWNG